MAALIDEIAGQAESPAPASEAGAVWQRAAQEAERYSTTGDMIKSRMPDLVKGAGLAPKGGNTVLSDQGDILTRSAQASLDIRTETARGFQSRASVVKSMNPSFLNQFGHLATALQQPSMFDLFKALPGGADVLKSFTAGNLGLPGAVYGNVPSSGRPC